MIRATVRLLFHCPLGRARECRLNNCRCRSRFIDVTLTSVIDGTIRLGSRGMNNSKDSFADVSTDITFPFRSRMVRERVVERLVLDFN